jgi:hypothetical protein
MPQNEEPKETMMIKEIKKEYLKEHLDSVETLIEGWIGELSMPPILAPQKGVWGWQSPYRSVIENDPDNNHILRKHLRSRALWNHHTNWERKIEHIWQLKQSIRKLAELTMDAIGGEGLQYHEDYLNTALWKGFEKALGKESKLLYSSTDDNIGVKYGAYRIEESATDADTRSVVEENHIKLIDTISVFNKTKELVDDLNEVERVQEQMKALAGRLLKSKDILYPCRFCRHLWK